MCYYFGITLKNSLLFGCDRTFNNKETGENRSDSKRYSIFEHDRAFLPIGNLAFCVGIGDFLHDVFGAGLELFEDVIPIYSKLLSSDYRKAKEENIAKLKAMGKPEGNENVDCLYGGLLNGAPFIISVSSTDDFQLKLINKPPQFIALNQIPPVLEYVKKTLQAFIGAVTDKGTDEVWTLGKRFLPTIIRKISFIDELVSPNGDLIFVTDKGIQTFEFGKKEIPLPEAEFMA